MTLKERYKFHSRKSMKPFTRLLFLVIIGIIAVPTFARYKSIGSANSIMPIAAWSILVNGEQITNQTNQLTQPISLLNSADDTDKIDAGDECYFDIVINPSTTEVSVSYTISLDLSLQNNTLPEGTQIKKYEKYRGHDSEFVSSTNVNDTEVSISENIILSNSQTSLSTSDIRKYRIFLKIPDYINAEEDQEYDVIPTITIQQYI